MRLGGATEVALELGISRQRLSQVRDQPGFPDPVGEIAAGAIWDLDQVALWSGSGLRRSAGRPATRRQLFSDRYLLDKEPIGDGGFADVYRAVDLKRQEAEPHGVVAIKLLRELEDVEVRRRFMRELRLIADCSHPNVVSILDDGEDELGRLWYAMPLAQGSLDEETDRFVGNDERIVHVLRQVCAGVKYAHDRGIFHRDLKPANVLRVGTDTWAISDFGLAREAERKSTALTSTLQGVGTYFFAAPESWRGAKCATAPADIYSLGKLLQNLVTGEVPIEVDPPDGLFRHVIAKATRQRIEDRYASVDEFVVAVERAVSSPGKWLSPEDRAAGLEEALALEVPAPSALAELVDLVSVDDGREVVAALRGAIATMSHGALEQLWNMDREGLVRVVDRYGAYIRDAQLPFGFCDQVANFFDRVVLVTNDAGILGTSVGALVEMGYAHNRWHVNSVAVEVLQRIREPDQAAAAADAVRGCSARAVDATISEFAAKSLHPVVRDAVLKMRLVAAEGREKLNS
ncbi:MAG: serine/threonine-protein kinase [Ilumatobacteraceae bacterium]|nr:serine/threonine-protein kinase [Ilumatobacteraceae bacterium]